MYRALDGLADAAALTGIRAVLSNDVALPEHRLDTIEDNVQAFQKNHGRENGRIRVSMGLEWLPLSDLALMQEIGRRRKELGMGLHIHLCESVTEVEDASSRFGGKTPVQVAYETGCLGPDVVAAHCVHLTDNDIKLLAETGTSVSYNPGSNAKLGNGVLRLQALQAAGVNVGMGIDACECYNSTDMFETLKIGALMQRAVHQDAALTPAKSILRMATNNGAKALGIEAGSLKEGKKADVIVLDLKRGMMFTPLLTDVTKRKEMLESHLVFGCNGTAVQYVFVDGKMVVKDFEIVGVDEEQVRTDMDGLFESIAANMTDLTMDSQTKC
jgi:5-methylthioadenosine/S-adenosylhomocysteine deaminase